MTYQKPKLSKLDHAVSAIQGHGKPASVATDVPLQIPNAATMGAYEADE